MVKVWSVHIPSETQCTDRVTHICTCKHSHTCVHTTHTHIDMCKHIPTHMHREMGKRREREKKDREKGRREGDEKREETERE